MDIASAVSAVGSADPATLQGTVQISMLRKTLDMQAQNAQQLIEAARQTPVANNPPHLGQGVDTYA